MSSHAVDKIDDVTPASVRKQFSLSLLRVAPRNLIFKLYNDDIECTCVGVEARQLSINYVFFVTLDFFFSTEDIANTVVLVREPMAS